MTTRDSIVAEANPTPFKMTFLASNVIAAIVLPGFNSALWTWFDVFVFFYPCIKLIIADISTSYHTMICCTTFHADFLATFTSCFCPEQTLFSDILQTAVSGTPPKIRIKVDVNLQPKSVILL